MILTDLTFCWDIPSHEKNPDPGDKKSRSEANSEYYRPRSYGRAKITTQHQIMSLMELQKKHKSK